MCNTMQQDTGKCLAYQIKMALGQLRNAEQMLWKLFWLSDKPYSIKTHYMTAS